MKLLDWHDFHDSLMEFKDFHDFIDYPMKFNDCNDDRVSHLEF